MRRGLVVASFVAVAGASFALGAETRRSLAETYDAVAVTILGAKSAESGIVKAILQEHHESAKAAFEAGDHEEAAAQMALFANEGDNRVGGIRKRLLEGGHHHNAEGEAQGVYEPGYVVVTKAVKKQALDASAALRAAQDDAARQAAWASFEAAAAPLCK